MVQYLSDDLLVRVLNGDLNYFETNDETVFNLTCTVNVVGNLVIKTGYKFISFYVVVISKEFVPLNGSLIDGIWRIGFEKMKRCIDVKLIDSIVI